MAAGDPLKGTDGTVEIGAVSSEVEIKYVKDWELKSEIQTEDDGPFINHDVIDEVAGGTKDELTINGRTRKGGDPGLTDLIAAKGSRERFVLTATSGLTVTIASGLVKAVTVKTDAKGGQDWSATISGAAVITTDATTP